MQHQASIGYERQLGRQLSFAADYVHMSNRDLPLRYNLNPGIKAEHGPHGAAHPRRFPGAREPAGAVAVLRATSVSSSTSARPSTTASTCRSRSASPTTGARASRTRSATAAATPDGTPTPTNDFQVLGRAQPGSERRPDQPRPAAHGHAQRPVRSPVDPGPDGGAVARLMTGTPFTIHNSNVDANRNGVLIDPLAGRAPTAASGQNAITVENEGGRNGAYGPGSRSSTCGRATGCGCGEGAHARLLLRSVQHHERGELRQPDRRHAVGLSSSRTRSRRRVPAAVPDRRASLRLY